jgi:hypothetical protein
MDVWYGKFDCQEMVLGEMLELASVADRFQITEVVSVVEAIMGQLSMDTCGELWKWSGRCGLWRLEADALKMAGQGFEEFVTTAGFLRIGEDALGSLVDDDRLVARNEEAV